MTRRKGRDEDDDLPMGWKLLVLVQVAKDLLEEDAQAANIDIIPSKSASPPTACTGGDTTSFHKQQKQSRPRKKERLDLGSSKQHMIFPDKIARKATNLSYNMDHHHRGRRLNTHAGEGTSTDTTLQRCNFFPGEASNSSARANIDVAAAANPPPPPPQVNAQQEMAADEEGWRNVHRDLGGSELVAIGEKTVTKSDRDKHQSRLLLTNDLMANVYMQVSETERDDENDGINSDGGMAVMVLDQAGRQYNMKCRYRECHRGMVFNGGWNNFLKNHDQGLQDVPTLSISAFRSRERKLCFVFLPRGGNQDHQD